MRALSWAFLLILFTAAPDLAWSSTADPPTAAYITEQGTFLVEGQQARAIFSPPWDPDRVHFFSAEYLSSADSLHWFKVSTHKLYFAFDHRGQHRSEARVWLIFYDDTGRQYAFSLPARLASQSATSQMRSRFDSWPDSASPPKESLPGDMPRAPETTPPTGESPVEPPTPPDLAAQREALAEKEAALANLSQRIADRQRTIANVADQLVAKQRQIENREAAVAATAKQLEAQAQALADAANAETRPRIVEPAVNKELRTVKVFYGTNRSRNGLCKDVDSATWNSQEACKPNDFYTAKPMESGIEVGSLVVSFPPDHQVGKIERPLSIFSIPLREEDPERDVVFTEVTPSQDYDSWVQDVQATGRDQAFIYVHGYANSFADAARRAAQIAYDLDFDVEEDFRGLPMMFSWPSGGRATVRAYNLDYDISLESAEAFNEFLDLVKGKAKLKTVHVIAHSMGNRVVARALDQRDETRVINELVLAAPDIWANTFRRRFLKKLPKIADRVTLYVSDNDRALIASSKFRSDEARAGQLQGKLIDEDVDRFFVVNASDLPSDFLAHSYYADNTSMLSDVYDLLKGVATESRPLIQRSGNGWHFKSPPAVPGANAIGWLTYAVVATVLLVVLFLLWKIWRRLKPRPAA